MPDDRTGFVVQNLNRVRPFFTPIIRSPEHPGQHVLWPPQPFEADNSRCGRFRFPMLDCSERKSINIITCHRYFFCFHSTLNGGAVPWVRYIAVKFTGRPRSRVLVADWQPYSRACDPQVRGRPGRPLVCRSLAATRLNGRAACLTPKLAQTFRKKAFRRREPVECYLGLIDRLIHSRSRR